MIRKDAEFRVGACGFCDSYPVWIFDGKLGASVCLQCATLVGVAMLDALVQRGAMGDRPICPKCLSEDIFNCPCTDVISRPKDNHGN
jgi:hypothetical protein